MAAPTVAQVKARIETLADAVVTTLLTGSEERIARSTLPAIEVHTGPDSEVRNGSNIGLVTREYQLWLFVAEIVRPESYADVQAALDACDPYLDSVRDYFRPRPRLEDVNLTNSLVNGTTPLVGSGPVTTPYKDTKTYSAVRWTFNVTVSRT